MLAGMRAGPAAGRGCSLAPARRSSIRASAAPTTPAPPSPLAFSFSAGGLLFPYHWGVAAELCERGLLNRAATPVGGASAGSIIVACLRSGLPFDRVTDACLALAADCRTGGTRARMGPCLEATLRELLPEDVHLRCSAGGTAHIAVTRLFPPPPTASSEAKAAAAVEAPPSSSSSPPPPPPPLSRLFRGELLSSFDSRDDLISAVLTSSHIPWYLDGRPTRTFRGGECVDGGLTQFIPAIPGAVALSSSSSGSESSRSGSDSDGDAAAAAAAAQTRLVRVTCFPSRAVDAAMQRASRVLATEGLRGAGGAGGVARPSAEADAAAALERAAADGALGAPSFADLSPDRFADWGVTMREAIAMALEPAPEETLRALLDKGREDARRWVEATSRGVVVPASAAAAVAAAAARG